jgi:hypothetical protein
MLFTPPYLEHLEPGHEIWNLDEKQAKFIDKNDKRASLVHIPQFCNFLLRLIYKNFCTPSVLLDLLIKIICV